jgi:Family of unknown function (DUF5719)
VRAPGQLAAAIVVLVVVLAGAAVVDRGVEARAVGAGPPGHAPSGAWFCPHGGGTGWTVTLEVANPGSRQVQIRVRELGVGKPPGSHALAVDAGSTLAIPVKADASGASSVVEYFGGWVAASWVEHAGGGETGVAAEPCSPAAGGPWLMADASTQKGDDDSVVVMNPFAADAVVSLTIFTDRRDPVKLEVYTDVVLKPFRSTAFPLNKVLGYASVGARVDVSVGRVAAAVLDASKEGGLRASLGYLGAPPRTLIFPGGADSGRSALEILSSSQDRVGLTGDLLEQDTTAPVTELGDTSVPTASAQTYPLTTSGPSTLVVRSDGPGVAADRRTFGISSDQASTIGAGAPAADWVVLPAVAGSPNRPGLVLANPSDTAVEVRLAFLPSGDRAVPSSVTVRIPAGRSAHAPADWLASAPNAAVLATATAGTFVPAAASYSLGREGVAAYAVALGVRIPDAWVP